MLLRIHCECGGTWDVYSRDNWKDDTARQCPHCFKEISAFTWQSEIIPAFASMMDANRELKKVHTGYNKPLFAVDFVADPMPKTEGCPLRDAMLDYDLNI